MVNQTQEIEVTNGNCPLLNLVLEGVNALNTPLVDRTEALLIVATGLRVMRPEPRHAIAMLDLEGEAAA